jgi:hypothetical protein
MSKDITETTSKDEIEHLIQKRCLHRLQKEWTLADTIKQNLELKHGVQLFDNEDPYGTIWKPIPLPKQVQWSELSVPPLLSTTLENTKKSFTCKVPFIVNTVNTPHYRERYQTTRSYLESEWQAMGREPYFDLHVCHLLDLRQYSNNNVGPKGILMKGWRTVLLPWLATTEYKCDFLLVGEDDLRFPPGVSPQFVYDQCANVFTVHNHIEVLSLGHSWSQLAKQDTSVATEESKSSLLSFLHEKTTGGLHATTLLAFRWPRGVRALQDAISGAKLQHLDQFLFHSPDHNLALALSDPPLAGWVEVQESLTPSGSGHRRQGGGRLGRLPPFSSQVTWVQRSTIEKH